MWIILNRKDFTELVSPLVLRRSQIDGQLAVGLRVSHLTGSRWAAEETVAGAISNLSSNRSLYHWLVVIVTMLRSLFEW